ncbi:LolA family protein [Natronobacterium gregoryi]|uniref:DUF2092 domain-containing protein n=2 Tax=Natronobacterium gregoryi TaxID=44930 RepID=L0AKW1_NATGS|nr:hypothetical protein [Natronobacterium gregoryi]AFZ74446.1 hypothetical protein Natgr_3321 [Natronobacterium gregoryi SP2]ELY72257.1 hypothetical protein C490_04047 [Natronobacterium gregoryi SP2]PLK18071.1 DUF2092 domain-containing protein [Natronobacterium gregoryi SP2]SFJ74076.1 Outer membrane lipoprotein-sorting protein [Natronobacterium gregoryi]
MRRRQFLATSALGLAGCLAVPAVDPGGPPSSDDLLREALETRTRLTALEARRTMTMTTAMSTVERTDRIVQRPPGEQRLEVLESDDPDTPPGTVSVRSRAVTWESYPEDDVVTERHHPNRVVADRTRLVLEELLERYDLDYEGHDTVNGRTAHRIEADPNSVEIDRSIDLLVGETTYRIPLEETPVDNPEEATVSRSIWIDDEYRYPVKERNVVRDADGEILHRVTVTYEDLALDSGLERGPFSYEPPADAEVVEIGTEPEGIFETRAAAEKRAPYELPEPELPEPYVLDRITIVEKGEGFGTTTTQWYVDPALPERELFLAVREVQRFEPAVLEETNLEFEGNTVYHRDGRIESLFWDCGGLNYELSSPLASESLEEIAPSVGCLSSRT